MKEKTLLLISPLSEKIIKSIHFYTVSLLGII